MERTKHRKLVELGKNLTGQVSGGTPFGRIWVCGWKIAAFLIIHVESIKS
jgi:hypothetical protein